MKKSDKKEEELIFENEFKKLKLSAETGARFIESDTEKLPANVESQWLDYIMSFEEAYQKRKVTKIEKLLGYPALPAVSTLSDEELPDTLTFALKLLSDQGIGLDVLYDVPEREVYRFITEELLHEEIQIIDVPGMVSHFTYEDFHPNNHEDLKRYTEEFVEMVMTKRFEYMESLFIHDCTLKGMTVSSETLLQQLKSALAQVDYLRLGKMTILSVVIEEDRATVQAELYYETKVIRDIPVTHLDEASFEFKHDYGFWYLQSVSIPGLDI